MAEIGIATTSAQPWKTATGATDKKHSIFVRIYRLAADDEQRVPLRSTYRFKVYLECNGTSRICKRTYTHGPHSLNGLQLNNGMITSFPFPSRGDINYSEKAEEFMFYFDAECLNLASTQSFEIQILNVASYGSAEYHTTPYKFIHTFSFTTDLVDGPANFSAEFAEFEEDTCGIHLSWNTADKQNLDGYQLTLVQRRGGVTSPYTNVADTARTYNLSKNTVEFDTTNYPVPLLAGCQLYATLQAVYSVNYKPYCTKSVNTSIVIPGFACVFPFDTKDYALPGIPYVCTGKVNGVKQWKPAIAYLTEPNSTGSDKEWHVANIGKSIYEE